MTLRPPHLPEGLEGPIRDLAGRIRDLGGRAFLVGGFVRDTLRTDPGKDVDVEVFGVPLSDLEDLLGEMGTVIRVGRQFAVLRVKGLDVDFSLPRRDSKVGAGHRGFVAEADPDMTPEEAVRRRDLTVNAMLMDPLTGELLDPAGGREDLRLGRMRAVDPATFPEDPLRPLRVAQLAARLELTPDAQLLGICRAMDLSELPAERIWDEWQKMLLRGKRPSLGLGFLLAADLLCHTPPLQALVGLPQDPDWHPEGDVWVHTLRVVDAAAGLRTGRREDDLQVMLGALCHDLGKAGTTEFLAGRWRSHQHDSRGAGPTRALLGNIGAPAALADPVVALVRRHLHPTWFQHAPGAKPNRYRRLARSLTAAGTTMRLLERVARADFLGRTTEEALGGGFPAGDAFLAAAEAVQVQDAIAPDAVLGRHLIARGLTPGPRFGPILESCRAVQDESGWDDPDRILDRVLAEDPEQPPG